MTLTSEPFNFTDIDGHVIQDSKIIMVISAAGSGYDAFSYLIDDSVISADSAAITYTKPTATQRKQTNLSFAGYPDNTNDGINNIFVSGTNTYRKGDKVGSKDYKKVDPHIAFYVDGCGSGGCQALVQATFTIDDWHNNPQMQKTQAILESLRLN